MVEVLDPLLSIIFGDADIVVVAALDVPGLTVNVLLTPFWLPEEFVAVMVQFPTLVMLTVWEESTPDEKFAVVPCPVPMVQLDVIETVPLKVVTVVPVPSIAVSTILNVCPACFALMFPEGNRFTVNPVSVPALTISKVELVSEDKPALEAASV